MGKLKQKQQSLANNDRTSIIIKQRWNHIEYFKKITGYQ